MTAMQADGSPAAVVQLGAHLGKLTEALTRHGDITQEEQRLAQLVTPLAISLLPIPSSNTLDLPDVLGPKTGFHWNVRRLTAQGFSAGTVTVWLNSAQGEELFTFPSAGFNQISNKELLLNPGERLVFTASGLSGTAVISVRGHIIPAKLYGVFVL